MTEFKAINWNQIIDRVDYSAWSRLNDFIWEPERVPIYQDKKEFEALDTGKKEALLMSFAALGFLSTIQIRYASSAFKPDSVTPQEVSVISALTYLEAIANKAYTNIIQNLIEPKKVNSYFDWANHQADLVKVANEYINIYQHGTWWQKKIALSFMQMGIYHVDYFATLRAFGDGKLTRTAEAIKLAIRATSFNAMYPGVKFRIKAANCSESEQAEMEKWTDEFVKKIAAHFESMIKVGYTPAGWEEDATHYFHYSLNKNFMNLGFKTMYPEDSDSLSETLQKGLIKSADFEDFFYYSNDNALTKFVDKTNK